MVKLNILSINAHPHDFTHMAGTLGIHKAKGDNVTVVSLTPGTNVHNEKKHDELMKPESERDMDIINQPDDEIKKIKIEELEKACAVFDIDDVRVLDYPQPFRLSEFPEAIKSLADIILDTRPHVLIMQSPFPRAHHGRPGVSADDHIETALATIEAKALAGVPGSEGIAPHSIATTLYPGVYFNNNEVDFTVDISDWFEKRVAAEEMYVSQGHTPEWSKRRMLVSLGNSGWFAHTLYAESFVREAPELVSEIPMSPLSIRSVEEPIMEKFERMIGEKGKDF
ncbi:MAG: hypothetical protein CL768_02445 [Chloroflexi bacterium]|nr:hypothetical protein [Chloroflexota bacterium]